MSRAARPEVLQIAPLSPASRQRALEDAYVLHRLHDAPDPAALLAEVGPRIRAVATTANFGVPSEVMAQLPALEVISSYGVGVDGIDFAACAAAGVRVACTPDVLNDAVAELTLGLMLALGRRIPEADAHVRSGRWETEGAFPLTAQLAGASVGILGLGRIGREIAARCAAMKMRVSYHGRRAQPDLPYAFRPDLTEMAREVDWLVAALPATEATRGIVGREVLAALGPRGRFVNVGRGALHDEAALIEALASGAIAGAALDVFEDEPRVPEALRAAPNVVLSPHHASATEATRTAMAQLVIDNLAAHFAGRALLTEIKG